MDDEEDRDGVEQPGLGHAPARLGEAHGDVATGVGVRGRELGLALELGVLDPDPEPSADGELLLVVRPEELRVALEGREPRALGVEAIADLIRGRVAHHENRCALLLVDALNGIDQRRRHGTRVHRAHHARLHAALQLGERDGLRHARECGRARILGRIWKSGTPKGLEIKATSASALSRL